MIERRSDYLIKYGDKIFPKYSDDELLEDLIKYKNGGKTLRKFLNHFFREIRYTALYKKNPDKSLSPFQTLNDDGYIADILEKIKHTESKGGTFYSGLEDYQKVDAYMRFNSGIASQFDPKHIHQINNYAKEYFNKPDGVFIVHDPSSGWGCRLSCNVAIGNHYLSTDPNKELNKCLNAAKQFLSKNFDNIIDLRLCGSEVLIDDWVDMCDYSFTSPPYFDLEIYSGDDSQSINKKVTSKDREAEYQKWIQDFVIPTIENQYRYVVNGGFAAINIKNIQQHMLYDDWKRCFIEHGGFTLVDELQIDWSRVKNVVVDSKSLYAEKIMVFKVNK